MTDAPHDSTTHGFGRGMLLLAAANGAYIVTAYAVTTITARVLEPAAFGSFGVVMAWITILTALLVKGLSTSIAREMAGAEASHAAAWHAGRSLGIRLSIGLAIVGVLLAPLAARVFGDATLALHFAIGALGALTFGVNAVLLAWPTGLRRYERQAVAQVAYALARLLLVVGGAVTFGLPGAVVGYVLAPLLAALSLPLRHPPSDAPIAPVRARMRRAVVPISLASIAVTAYFVVDVFALAAVVGGDDHEVGLYVAYGTVAHVPFFLLQAASVVLVPALAAARSAAARASAIRRTMTDTFVLLAGPVLLLAAAGDAASRIVFGADYVTSTSLAAPLAIATGAVTMLANLIAVDVAIGRLRTSLVLAGGGAVVLALAGVWAAGLEQGTPASNVAWAACAVSVLVAGVLGIELRLRHGALLESRRALIGGLLAVAVAIPPLFLAGDVARVIVATACGLAWLGLVLRLHLVDVRRSGAVVARDAVDA